MQERFRIQTRRTGQETTENAAMEEKQERKAKDSPKINSWKVLNNHWNSQADVSNLQEKLLWIRQLPKPENSPNLARGKNKVFICQESSNEIDDHQWGKNGW